MTEDAARLQDELELYQDYGNFAVDNLFWSLTFLNAVLFQTPNASEVKEKLLAQKRPYEGLITAYYPGPEGQRQVACMTKTTGCSSSTLSAAATGSRRPSNPPGANGRKTAAQVARHLSQMNPHWKQLEWSAMISHQTQLITSIARPPARASTTPL